MKTIKRVKNSLYSVFNRFKKVINEFMKYVLIGGQAFMWLQGY